MRVDVSTPVCRFGGPDGRSGQALMIDACMICGTARGDGETPYLLKNAIGLVLNGIPISGPAKMYAVSASVKVFAEGAEVVSFTKEEVDLILEQAQQPQVSTNEYAAIRAAFDPPDEEDDPEDTRKRPKPRKRPAR